MAKRTNKKSNLPPELFKNQYAGKRGKGELLKTIHVRLSIDDHKNMIETLKTHKITQSNFIRYAVRLALDDINNIMILQQSVDDEKKR